MYQLEVWGAEKKIKKHNILKTDFVVRRQNVCFFLLRNVTKYSLKFYQWQTYVSFKTNLFGHIKNLHMYWSITNLMYIMGHKTMYPTLKLSYVTSHLWRYVTMYLKIFLRISYYIIFNSFYVSWYWKITKLIKKSYCLVDIFIFLICQSASSYVTSRWQLRNVTHVFWCYYNSNWKGTFFTVHGDNLISIVCLNMNI